MVTKTWSQNTRNQGQKAASGGEAPTTLDGKHDCDSDVIDFSFEGSDSDVIDFTFDDRARDVIDLPYVSRQQSTSVGKLLTFRQALVNLLFVLKVKESQRQLTITTPGN